MMDVLRAKQQLELIDQYVSQMVTNKPRLYSKSKTRWQDIAELCLRIANNLSEVLEDRIISTATEFDDLSNTQIYQTLTDIQQNLNNLCQFAKIPEMLNADKCKQVFHTYSLTLSNLIVPDDMGELTSILRMLTNWFNLRFCTHTENFKYKISDMNAWIYAWVLSFGYHIEHHMTEQFKLQVDQWSDDVTHGSNLYPVPKIVYAFVKTSDPNHYTLTAVILWDLLVSKYLSGLIIADSQNVYLDAYKLYDQCNQYNPTALNHYSDTNYVESIISRELGINSVEIK